MSSRWKGQGNSASNIEMQTLNDGGNDSKEKKWKKIFEPEEKFLKRWNKILVVSRVIALFLDPLFFYVPVINEDNKCIGLDKRLWITAIVLRTIDDIIYLTNIVLQFRTAFEDDKQGKKLNTDSKAIARRYLKTNFLFDFLAILPIPQVIISKEFSKSGGTKLLNSLVLFQYAPRVLQIYISWKKLITISEEVNRAIWVKATLNLFLYILAGHALGACWYFFSTQRLVACWYIACENHSGCVQSSFKCDHRSARNVSFFNDSCGTNTGLFDFGIFLEAVQSGILGSTDFPQKLFSGIWWGMRNLSSYGSNLQTSNYIWEKCFALCIFIFGLLLFLYFIGNLQFTTSKSIKNWEKNLKRKKQEENIKSWMYEKALPSEMKKQIMEHLPKDEDEDVYVENLIPNLPSKLQGEVKHHICFELLKNLNIMKDRKWDNPRQLLLDIITKENMCGSFKPVFYDEQSYIVQEGDPIVAIFLITKGTVWSSSSTSRNIFDEGTTTTFRQVERLEKGQLFGEELLDWIWKKDSLVDMSKLILPVSSKTLKAHTKVEAFALMADDFKEIVSRRHDLGKNQVGRVASSHFQAWDFKVFDRSRPEGWDPPTPPNVKINYDAAVGFGGSYLAVVCRDHNSEIVGVWSDFCDNTNPLVAEARAALLAVINEGSEL